MRTLPSLMTVDSLDRGRRALRLTIVFHPNIDRIGEHVDLIDWPGDEVRPRLDAEVGRLAPDFSDGKPLAEAHISRKALLVRTQRGVLLLAAPESGVACRIGRHEVDQLALSDETLKQGVPIRLGHGVVLYLRDVLLPGPRREVPEDYYPGCSAEAGRIRQLMQQAAGCDLPVLILGQSGVGKEFIARGIHEHSQRRKARMVAVNMAAISESLAPAELFGTAKGAFTGALSREGFFQQADGGTLFLDEIGDTPIQIQVQLLRALQEREVQVVGGQPVAVDVRVLAATERSVEEEAGFRKALQQRLAGLTIDVPPLSARKEDIGPQVLRMLEVAGCYPDDAPFSAHLQQDETAAWWARVFFDFLLGDWSGNSRELNNMVQHTVLLADEPWQYQRRDAPTREEASVSDDTLAETYEAHGFEPYATRKALGLSQGAIYRWLRAHPDCRIACDLTAVDLDAAIAAVGRDPVALSQNLRVSLAGLLRQFPQLKER